MTRDRDAETPEPARPAQGAARPRPPRRRGVAPVVALALLGAVPVVAWAPYAAARRAPSFDGALQRGAALFGVRFRGGEARFGLLAPRAASAALVGEFNAWDCSRHPMRESPWFDTSVWTLDVPAALVEGEPYAYCLDGSRLVADPFSRRLSRRYPERNWVVSVAERPPRRRPATRWVPPRLGDATLIYELDVRTFTLGHPGVPSAEQGTYRGILRRAEELRALSVDYVELAPLAPQPFELCDGDVVGVVTSTSAQAPLCDGGRGGGGGGAVALWGYSPVGVLPTDDARGTAGDLREVIAGLHDAGIGVVLDVVLTHLAPEASVPRDVDETLYLDNDGNGRLDLSPGDQSGYGPAVALWRLPAAVLVHHALETLVEDFGVDGFRIDGVHLAGQRSAGALLDVVGSLRRRRPHVRWIIEHLPPRTEYDREGLHQWDPALSGAVAGLVAGSAARRGAALRAWGRLAGCGPDAPAPRVHYGASHDEDAVARVAARAQGPDASRRLQMTAALLAYLTPGPHMLGAGEEAGLARKGAPATRGFAEPLAWGAADAGVFAAYVALGRLLRDGEGGRRRGCVRALGRLPGAGPSLAVSVRVRGGGRGRGGGAGGGPGAGGVGGGPGPRGPGPRPRGRREPLVPRARPGPGPAPGGGRARLVHGGGRAAPPRRLP